MTLLRCELVPSLAANFTDPGGLFWPGRVEAWRESFKGTAYQPTDSPRVSTLPSRAIVYIAAPDNVMERNLDGLRLNWSDRTWAVAVQDVRIVTGIESVDADTAEIQEGSIWNLGIAKTFGVNTGRVVTIVAIGAAIALVIYASNKSGGTKSWE